MRRRDHRKADMESISQTNETTTYEVRDADGNLICLRDRIDGPDGKQVFSHLPGRRDMGGMPMSDVPLYGSEDVRDWPDEAPVIVVEGEKVRDALHNPDSGLYVLGTLGTGHKPNADRLEVLRGREVILWPDADKKGHEHMQKLGGDLQGVAASVQWYKWHDALEKGDAADHPAVQSRDEKALGILLDDLMGAPLWESADDGVNTVNTVNTIPRELPAAEEFPVDALPRSCAGLVEEAAAAIGCPPDFIALPMLVMLGTGIGNSRVLKLKEGWEEGPAIYAAVVAEPGEAKSPAAGVATDPARRRQAKLRTAYRQKREEYEARMREFEKDKRDCRKNDLADPAPPEEPIMERTVVDDTTTEALVRVLEGSPRGVLVDKDELAAWVGSMDQYRAGGKGADRQFWLSGWSGKALSVDRRSLGEPLILQRPFVGVFGTIQPGVLSTLGHDRQDGMLDRFLFAYPDPVPSRWSDDEISVEARESAAALFDRLHALDMPLDDNGDPNPKRIRFSPDAKEVFADVVNTLGEERERPGFPARLKGPWAKLKGYLARLSLILAMCRCVEEGEPERVEARDVFAALVLLDYFKNHARRVYAGLYGHNTEHRLAEDLAEFLRDRGSRWIGTATELHEALKERGCKSLPTDPDRLTGTLLRIAERFPVFTVERGRRRVGDKVQRSVEITLGTTVHSVHSVHTRGQEVA